MYIDFHAVDAKMEGLDQVVLPRMVKIRQLYDAAHITDIPGWLEKELNTKLTEADTRFDGKNICITAGSRGIPEYANIMRTLITWLKSKGAHPFIVPAMGSHAGATVQGQVEMLATYGITEETMKVPIRATMETEEIGTLKDGTPVYCDKNAYHSDGIVVLNKIKPHTSFKGPHESGLLKMLCIGLGKHMGAATMHMKGYENFDWLIPEAGKLCLEKEPVVFGVGIVQNAYDEISELEVMEQADIVERDARLLEIAKDKLARFKFPTTDVLIIDQIGKNIGGSGFDPNVVARRDRIYPGTLVSQNIFVRGLTPETHHNASGIGTIEVTTLRCVRDIDWAITWTNMMTANFLPGCRIPCFAENDKQALRWAIRTCTGIDYSNARVIRIKDTMHMNEIAVSENLAHELENRDDVEILSKPYDICFGPDGYILDEPEA
ncbi:MAG: nickel-dependent lactate racemase [Intestinimonas sp.]|jgi:hypothetical protein|nr:nickel-dependent lactate racemase [Intestinimonas sp.]